VCISESWFPSAGVRAACIHQYGADLWVGLGQDSLIIKHRRGFHTIRREESCRYARLIADDQRDIFPVIFF
jgi:hypothetical protein